ncbi:MAG: NTP transferase domain-containing protein [Desulfovibrionaceae bacterium]|jgi:dTDP-glucose pyrophosphorylase|nr:NTP transferase domain-containing protein [Desulfovibrionaceae bacterium]
MTRRDQLDTFLAREDDSLLFALSKLNKTGEQILLVVDAEERLTGVVTDGDIRRFLLRKQNLESRLSEVMNREFTALREHERHRAKTLLAASRFNHVPIVDEAGRLVGLVSSLDYFRSGGPSLPNTVVIQAGGKGTRLAPLTRIIPKPLVPVGDKTFIELILDSFRASGFRDFQVVVNYKKELIKSYFYENGLTEGVSFTDEREYLGTVGGLRLLADRLTDTFLLTNCDIIAKTDMTALLDAHAAHDAELTVLGVEKRLEVPYGVIRADESGRISRVDEKPGYAFTIMSGIYCLEPSVLDCIPEGRPFGMDELVQALLDQGRTVACHTITDGWFDVGQFEEYKTLLKHFGAFNA